MRSTSPGLLFLIWFELVTVSVDGYLTNKCIRVDSTDQVLINMLICIALSGDCSNVAGWTVRPVVDVALRLSVWRY